MPSKRTETCQISGTSTDGDNLCHPMLVPSYLQAFDAASDKFGAERNTQKTEVVYYLPNLEAALLECKIDDVCLLASVKVVDTGSNALGVAVGPRVRPHTLLQEKRTAEIFDEVGKKVPSKTLPRIHGGQFGASHTQRRPVGALIAAKPRILDTKKRRGHKLPSKQPSRPTLTPSMARKKPLLSCTSRMQLRQRRSPGRKHPEDTALHRHEPDSVRD